MFVRFLLHSQEEKINIYIFIYIRERERVGSSSMIGLKTKSNENAI